MRERFGGGAGGAIGTEPPRPPPARPPAASRPGPRGLPSPSLYPPVAPAARPSSLEGLDNFACRPRSPVPGSNCTGERGRAVSNWTSRAPLLFFLTLELEANKTLQPGKEVKAVLCSGEYLKGARIPCSSCLQLGKHLLPSQLCLQLNTKTWRRLPHPSGRRKEAARPD
ncbi:hypothetical protein AB1E18_010611 [Capra hircus]